MEENKKTELGIDLTQMAVKVYNKIALWHNEECSDIEKSNRLKHVSHEVIEMILNDSLEQLNVRTKIKTISGEDYVEEKRETGILRNILNFKNKTKK